MKKIYTEVVIDMKSGETISETYFPYDGKITECKGGGGGVAYPEPTEEEREVWRQQAEFMEWQREYSKEQAEEREKLTPLMYESMGYIKDPETGEYVRDPRRVELEEKELERRLMGYEGRLPIDPAVTEQFEREERLAREGSARGGTSLVHALSDIKQRRMAAEYAIRHGAATGQQAFGIAFPGGGGAGGGAGGYGGGGGGLLGGMSQYRAGQFQSRMQAEYGRRQESAGRAGMTMAGARAGMYYGGMKGTAISPGWGTVIGAGAGLLASYYM